MTSGPKLALHALIALWLGLTVYLFLVAEPRAIGWAIIGPISIAGIYFATQWVRVRRHSHEKPRRRDH